MLAYKVMVNDFFPRRQNVSAYCLSLLPRTTVGAFPGKIDCEILEFPRFPSDGPSTVDTLKSVKGIGYKTKKSIN